MTVLCDVCGVRKAVVYQAHSGRRLCKECFVEDVKRRAREEIKRWGLFGPGDTLLLGLSGGKDSYVLLDVLTEIHSTDKIVAVSIVEGIPGYNREEDIARLREVAKDYGVDVVVTSIREYTGHSLTELVVRAWRRGYRISPCTYCGISRRRILNYYARMFGAHKTVTAHNLDDEVQTAVVNLLRGDIVGLLRLHPAAPPASKLVIPRAKPLRKVYEWETATYAYLLGFPMQETECMFINYAPTLRARVREALYRVERKSPGTLMRILETLDTLLEPAARELETDGLGRCERCGEPTSRGRRLCKLCEILEGAGVVRPLYSAYRDITFKPED
ncbi:MAG: TIGR00269 family protein [Desulfurococcales archaeon]|nr:TIGR00269 family protein [Desulfurococcales archaeon]